MPAPTLDRMNAVHHVAFAAHPMIHGRVYQPGTFVRHMITTNGSTTMKTLILRTALMLALMPVLDRTLASEPATPLRMAVTPSAMERELDHQINKLVNYPLGSTGMDGDVYVSFVINTDGKVEVLNAFSDNDGLCAYVLEKLAKVDIGTNPGGMWKTTHMRFRFHPEA